MFTEILKQKADSLPDGYQKFRGSMSDAEFLLWSGQRPEPISHCGMCVDLRGLQVVCKPTPAQNTAIQTQYDSGHWQRGVCAPDTFRADDLFQLLNFVKIVEEN